MDSNLGGELLNRHGNVLLLGVGNDGSPLAAGDDVEDPTVVLCS